MDVYYYDKKVMKVDSDKLVSLFDKADFSGKIWIDYSSITRSDLDFLTTKMNIHPLTAEDLFNKNTRVKVEEFNEYLFSVFYGMKSKKGDVSEFEIDFILGEKFLITSHNGKVDSFEKLKSDESKIESLMSKGLDFLMHSLLDVEVDNYFDIILVIDEHLQKVEDKVILDPDKKLSNDILSMKKKVNFLKRMSTAQREKIGFLAKNNYKLISKKSIPYFRDIYDHFVRVHDAVESSREFVYNLFDAYMSSVSNKMNEVMKVLSIIATIAMPLTLLSGISGTNFSYIPGLSSHNAFWVMVIFMLFIVFVMVFYFKHKKWV